MPVSTATAIRNALRSPALPNRLSGNVAPTDLILCQANRVETAPAANDIFLRIGAAAQFTVKLILTACRQRPAENVFISRPIMSHAASSKRENAMAGKSSSKSKKPTHEAFVVTGEGDNAFWTKLGAVWPHDDGKGFNIELIA